MTSPTLQPFRLGQCTVDLERRAVVHPDRTVPLTALEARLMAHLVERSGAVVSQDELLREVWGYAAGVRTRAPHHAVTRIRKKIELDPTHPVHLVSVYGEGYRLEAVVSNPEPTSGAALPIDGQTVARLRDRPTTFIGRRDELAHIDRWVQGSQRVLTVVGPAGAGKTRLCCRYASAFPDAFPGGSWLVELDGLTEPDQVAVAIANALGMRVSGTDHQAQLGAVLHARGAALLVLDDLQFDGSFLADWLEAAPQLRWMVTARRRLVLPDQQLLFLRPLQQEDALELLQTRAGLDATDGREPEDDGDDSTTLAQLVDSLDGLPLALELAAARLRIMGADGVLSRLDDRFRLLRSRDGAIDPRKTNLRAVLESSWHQLSPRARLGLAHCSVFRGAFSLEAAEAVIDLSAWPDDFGTWDILERLEDHSLLEVVGSTRRRPAFRLLHSIRDLAHEYLRTPGAVTDPSGGDQTGPTAAAATHARHAAYFARLGSPDLLFGLQTADGPATLKRLCTNVDEMVSALEWSAEAGSLDHAPRLADAVLEVASNRGPPALAEHAIDRVLALPGLPTSDRVRIAARRGRIRSNQGMWDAARGELEATLALATTHGTAEDVARIREALGEVEIAAGNLTAARTHLEQTLGWDHHAGDASVGLLAMVGLGQISQMEGDIETAATRFKAALDPIRRSGHKRMEAMLQCHIGSLDQEQGRLTRALQRYSQALTLAREIGSQIVEITARGNVAGVLVDLGRQEEAERSFEENLAQCRALGSVRIEAISLGNLGTLYRARGELDAAERAYLDSIELLEKLRDPTVATIMQGNLAEVYRQLERLSEASSLIHQVLTAIEAGHAAWAQGYFLGVAADIWSASGEVDRAWQALDQGEALLRQKGRLVDLGKLLCRRCSLMLDHQRITEARAALSEAEQVARETGSSSDAELGVEIARQQARFESITSPS